MSVFYTSDPHIHHKLVAKIRWKKAFPGIESPEDEHVLKWHDSILAQNWDATVGKDDVVWVLGDLAVSGTKTSVSRALDWVAARTGRKHLVPGNHDPVHPMDRDSHRWQKQYLEVFESVQLAARHKFTLSSDPVRNTRNVLLSHMPYTGDRDEHDRDTQWRLRDEGLWLLHGHLHGTTPFHSPGTRQIDVGLDPWNLKPVSQQELINLIKILEGQASSVLA